MVLRNSARNPTDKAGISAIVRIGKMCVYYVYQFFPDDCMIYGSLVFHRRRFHQDFPMNLMRGMLYDWSMVVLQTSSIVVNIYLWLCTTC